MRISTALALALAASGPSIARAQQPPIPPAGEPPPPQARTQEQAAITREAQDAYVRAHQDELWRQATIEVEIERRAAWEERGRQNIPPAVVVRPPTLEPSIAGRWGLAGNKALGLGIAAALKLRVTRWWGLEAAGGLSAFRPLVQSSSPDALAPAALSEISFFGSFWGSPQGYIPAQHVILRAGVQFLFPIQSPNAPPVYLAPFGGVGAVLPLGQLVGNKGYTAIFFESRLGYRFGLGSAPTSPIQGVLLDIVAGPAVGF